MKYLKMIYNKFSIVSRPVRPPFFHLDMGMKVLCKYVWIEFVSKLFSLYASSRFRLNLYGYAFVRSLSPWRHIKLLKNFFDVLCEVFNGAGDDSPFFVLHLLVKITRVKFSLHRSVALRRLTKHDLWRNRIEFSLSRTGFSSILLKSAWSCGKVRLYLALALERCTIATRWRLKWLPHGL